MPDGTPTDDEVARAIWAGDTEFLDRHLGCVCCCDEHTFEDCPARRWHGNETMTRADLESWATHYGMTLPQFLDLTSAHSK